jgi:CBS domain-containing protein
MRAGDIMTTQVVTVGPDAHIGEIAKLLLERRVSAVPVVGPDGGVLGVVSEGDLMRRPEIGTERHRSWWLSLLAGADELAHAYVKSHGLRARDVMSRPAVTVGEDAPLGEVARILEERRIKRVPVVRDDGGLTGIVSRADLLRALAARATAAPGGSSPDDRAIRERLLQTMKGLGFHGVAPLGLINVVVTDGVVHLWGLVRSEEQRHALRVAAETTPGVRSVEDHMSIEPLWTGVD